MQENTDLIFFYSGNIPSEKENARLRTVFRFFVSYGCRNMGNRPFLPTAVDTGKQVKR